MGSKPSIDYGVWRAQRPLLELRIKVRLLINQLYRGMVEDGLSRWAHNPEIASSNLASATKCPLISTGREVPS